MVWEAIEMMMAWIRVITMEMVRFRLNFEDRLDSLLMH